MPKRSATRRTASGKASDSIRITKAKTSPCAPHPKQWKNPRSSLTVKDGVFSAWKGQSPTALRPRRRSVTTSETTSTRLARSRTCRIASSAIRAPGRPSDMLLSDRRMTQELATRLDDTFGQAGERASERGGRDHLARAGGGSEAQDREETESEERTATQHPDHGTRRPVHAAERQRADQPVGQGAEETGEDDRPEK